ncbi:hypothetical protein DFQ26_002230 [Actinomortierella ambigua]|nr:hypothetical protein DFQ26_002230 [Actinomortierella ambigua]
MRKMSHSNGSTNGYFGVPPSSANMTGPTTSSYYPSLPIRNKSRTSSVSSTSTIVQPAHNLLHSSQGILLPKRQPTTSQVTSPAVSAVSAAAFSTATAAATSTTHPYSLASASSSSSSLSSLLSTTSNTANSSGPIRNVHMSAPYSSINSTASANGRPNHPVLVLEPLNNTFALKTFELPEHTKIKIGRQTGVSTAPGPTNGYFDSKVLSRVHAEVWSENSKVYIRDLKSSNGTFLNGRRLCPEGVESEPFQLNPNDNLEFGIDIMDENGTMLHEKVACRIFISRLALSSSGSPPNDARIRSGSTASLASTKGQGGANGTANGTQSGALPNHGGGQDSNFDLLVSRLQHELVRSQETNGDLQQLRHGLDDLGKVFVVTKQQQQQSRKNSIHSQNGGHHHHSQIKAASASPTIDYDRLMEERAMRHAAELEKMARQLETVQSEMEQQMLRSKEDMATVISESDTMRKELAEAMVEMTQVKLERDQAKDMLAELAAEQTQTLESLRTEQEAAVIALEAFHAAALERLTIEARQAREEMVQTHQMDMARALEAARQEIEEWKKTSATGPNHAREKDLEIQVLTSALEGTHKLVESLEKKVKLQQAEVRLLKDNREGLAKELQAEKEKVRELTRQTEYLATLTPTSPTSATTPGSPNGSSASLPSSVSTTTVTVMTPTGKTEGSKKMAATTPNGHHQHHPHEFSWAQFVFPMAKRNQPLMNQPSTMLMSGGFMLVGLGAYVLWHRAAGITPP